MINRRMKSKKMEEEGLGKIIIKKEMEAED